MPCTSIVWSIEQRPWGPGVIRLVREASGNKRNYYPKWWDLGWVLFRNGRRKAHRRAPRLRAKAQKRQPAATVYSESRPS